MNKKLASELAAVQVLYSQARAVLLKFPNVVSVGVGFRERKGKATNEPCFVVGVSSKSSRTKPQLPTKLLGVRVDVQKVSKPKLVASAAGAGDCKADGRDERGQIGLLAASGSERFAITALHVLMAEAVGTDVPSSSLKGTVVNGRVPGGDFERIGTLQQGGFDVHRDIALVKLDANVVVSDLLAGSPIKLRPPVTVGAGLLRENVQLQITTAGLLNGTLKEWPVSGTFATETGGGAFTGLAKFEINVNRIKPGWSGGVIFLAGTQQPLAVISFAGPAGRGISHAYGFPLAPHWDAWGLSTL